MSLNTDYHAQRPRDSHNEGPSVVRAVGNFEDGKLLYCPCDRRRIAVDKLDCKDALEFDVGSLFVPFDSRNAHEVTPFEGTRISVAF